MRHRSEILQLPLHPTQLHDPAADELEYRAMHLPITSHPSLPIYSSLSSQLDGSPYSPALYLARARTLLDLAFPDLAAGDAYRALLLLDYVNDYIDEGELNVGFSGLQVGDDDSEDPSSAHLSTKGASTNDGYSEEAAYTEEDEDENELDQTERDADGERVDRLELHAAEQALSCITAELSSTIVSDVVIDEEAVLEHVAGMSAEVMVLLVKSLSETGCIPEARNYCKLGLRRFGSATSGEVFRTQLSQIEAGTGDQSTSGTVVGTARRLVYPWNKYEPDRFAPETIEHINTHIVPKASPYGGIEVAVLDLPLLSKTGEDLGTTKHLGMFATRDLYEGDVVLEEESALTVVTDPTSSGLCEYCSGRWREVEEPSRPTLSLDPTMKQKAKEEAEKLKATLSSTGPKQPSAKVKESDISTCTDCVEAESNGTDTTLPTWCSPHCHAASRRYHSVLCSRPTASFHRAAIDPPSSSTTTTTPNGPLYSLLLLKTFALALSSSPNSSCHPLLLPETHHLYGVPPAANELTMPWSFTDHVLTPIAMLDALGIDVFSGRDRRGVGERGWWEGWVVNTLVAKYRGVASGRMGAGMNGKTEAAGCQTVFSMANHDCEPGVQWELADKMRFRVLPPLSSRASVSNGKDDKQKEGPGNGTQSVLREVVIRKGEEVKQCYCDRRMDVGQRREWMVGVLGGLCKCKRCVREAGELTSEA